MPPTVPGLFVGWRLESGMRYRGALYIADYDKIKKGNFQFRSLLKVPEKEVYFPDELVFPFANARKLAIRDFADKIPNIATTTNNSIKVKPLRIFFGI